MKIHTRVLYIFLIFGNLGKFFVSTFMKMQNRLFKMLEFFEKFCSFEIGKLSRNKTCNILNRTC